MTVDVTRDSTTCLACVYLNEYKVATAAFTLHASENKLVRVRSENICTLCKRKYFVGYFWTNNQNDGLMFLFTFVHCIEQFALIFIYL